MPFLRKFLRLGSHYHRSSLSQVSASFLRLSGNLELCKMQISNSTPGVYSSVDPEQGERRQRVIDSCPAIVPVSNRQLSGMAETLAAEISIVPWTTASNVSRSVHARRTSTFRLRKILRYVFFVFYFLSILREHCPETS